MRFETLAQARTTILALGTLIEAVAPDELRASIAEMAAGIVSLYDDGQGPIPPQERRQRR